jgi:hypothetical protein
LIDWSLLRFSNDKFSTRHGISKFPDVWMAKEIERNGLNAELVCIGSGATAIQVLVGGIVQAALGASNAVVAATLKGAPIIALGSNTSRPGMQLWVHRRFSGRNNYKEKHSRLPVLA